jgi:hypothetical protein
MAVGILFIARTPGYDQDLMSYLFGNILLVRGSDLGLMLALDVVVVALCIVLFPQLQAVCFDEEFARLRGLNVELYYLLLLCLTALTVVLLVTVVGIVLVIALLTLPAAIAGQLTSTLRGMMVGAALLSIGFTIAGLALSYGPDLPAGATTIVLAGLAYLAINALRACMTRCGPGALSALRPPPGRGPDARRLGPGPRSDGSPLRLDSGLDGHSAPASQLCLVIRSWSGQRDRGARPRHVPVQQCLLRRQSRLTSTGSAASRRSGQDVRGQVLTRRLRLRAGLRGDHRDLRRQPARGRRPVPQ